MIANCTGKVPGLRPITGKRVSRNSCWRVMSCNLWQKAAITCKTCIARRVGKLGKVRQLLNYLKFEFIASDFSYKYRRFIFHSQKKRFRFFFFFFKRNSMTRRERERNTKFSFSRRLFFTSFRLKKTETCDTHEFASRNGLYRFWRQTLVAWQFFLSSFRWVKGTQRFI